MLKAGDKAPDIDLPDADMNVRTLDEFSGENVVLYFYPRDDTPGCTIQANEFTDLIDEFDRANIRILGVSADDCFSHQSFREKYGLKIILLADVEREVCNRYGVIQEKEKDGMKKIGIVRSTFVIDPEGRLSYVEYGVSPKGHAGKILEFIRQHS